MRHKRHNIVSALSIAVVFLFSSSMSVHNGFHAEGVTPQRVAAEGSWRPVRNATSQVTLVDEGFAYALARVSAPGEIGYSARATERGRIYWTTDSGTNWQNDGIYQRERFCQISGVNRRPGAPSNDRGVLWGLALDTRSGRCSGLKRSRNGADGWEDVNGSTGWDFKQISAVRANANELWAVTNSDDIYRGRWTGTGPVGAQWQQVSGSLKQVSAVSYDVAWGVNSNDLIWRTQDGGTSWDNVSQRGGGMLKYVSAVDWDTAWGVNSTNAIYRTRDGGRSWEHIDGTLEQITATSYDVAWGVDNAGMLQVRGADPAEKRVTLKSLTVHETTENGDDEVYFKITVDGNASFLPTNLEHVMDDCCEGQGPSYWLIRNASFIGKNFQVDLMEHDDTSSDDLIGTVTVSLQSEAGPHTARLTGDGGDYSLEYEVSDLLAKRGFTTKGN